MKITKKTKNLAKTSQFFPFGKTLGKSYTANQHKQGVPEAQGRNDVSPIKGIDTFLQNCNRKNLDFVEMMLARLRALIHIMNMWVAGS